MLSSRERAAYGVYFGVLWAALCCGLVAYFAHIEQVENAARRTLENPFSPTLSEE